MADYILNMNILVTNINHRGQKDLSFEVRHKAYARPLAVRLKERTSYNND
jgi:hypothetical protein